MCPLICMATRSGTPAVPGADGTAFAAEVVAEIEALVGDGAVDDWDLEAIEMAARAFGLTIPPSVLLRADDSYRSPVVTASGRA